MPDRQPDLRSDHLLGAQDAARFLGIHRSTLHIAVKHHMIVPDDRTPGGHYRFLMATLESFRARLAHESATGEAGALAPLLALADMSRRITEMAGQFNETNFLHDFAQAAVAGILSIVHGTDTCYIAQRTLTTQSRYGLKFLAHHGVPERAVVELIRPQPSFTFATTNVMRTRQREVVSDTSQVALHSGTQQSMRLSPVGAYAIVPIVLGDEAIGVIGCISQRPRQYSAFDLTFIESVAHELAVAMQAHEQNDKNASLEKAVAVSGKLIHSALAWRAELVEHTDDISTQETASLRPPQSSIAEREVSYHLPPLTAHQDADQRVTPRRDTPDEEYCPSLRLERLKEATAVPERMAHAVTRLIDLFIELSMAKLVCTTGFDVNLPTTDRRLLTFARDVADGEEKKLREVWATRDGMHTALAVRVALRSGYYGSVAATWSELRPWHVVDQSTLETFATMYLLLTTASDK